MAVLGGVRFLMSEVPLFAPRKEYTIYFHQRAVARTAALTPNTGEATPPPEAGPSRTRSSRKEYTVYFHQRATARTAAQDRDSPDPVD